MKNKNIGSNFDEFLDEEEILAESEAIAFKKVLAWQLQMAMNEQHLTKEQAAKRMKTSRMALDRLLDPNNISITLKSIENAVIALGKRVHIEIKNPS